MFALYGAAGYDILHRSVITVLERAVMRLIGCSRCRRCRLSKGKLAIKHDSRPLTGIYFMRRRGLSRLLLRPFCFLTMISGTREGERDVIVQSRDVCNSSRFHRIRESPAHMKTPIVVASRSQFASSVRKRHAFAV